MESQDIGWYVSTWTLSEWTGAHAHSLHCVISRQVGKVRLTTSPHAVTLGESRYETFGICLNEEKSFTIYPATLLV